MVQFFFSFFFIRKRHDFAIVVTSNGRYLHITLVVSTKYHRFKQRRESTLEVVKFLRLTNRKKRDKIFLSFLDNSNSKNEQKKRCRRKKKNKEENTLKTPKENQKKLTIFVG